MTTYRDRLPLAHPDYLGLPYHGLVTNEVLALPNSQTLPVAFGGHQTVLVRAADAVVPTFTPDQQAFNTAQGYTWQNFALLSGLARNIGGGDLGAQSYLYHDGDHAWIIDVELAADDLELTLMVYLRQIFGYLDDAGEAPTMSARRKLDELTFTPVRTGGTDQTEEMAAYGRYLFMTHSQTGSVTAANVAVSRAEADASDFGVGFAYQFGGSGYVVHNALSITLSGSGSLTGTVGSGISGVIAMLASAAELTEETYTVTGENYPSSILGTPPWPYGTWSLATNYERVTKVYAAVNSMGTVIWASESLTQSTEDTWTTWRADDLSEYQRTRDYAYSDSASASFGGSTLTQSASSTIHEVDHYNSVGVRDWYVDECTAETSGDGGSANSSTCGEGWSSSAYPWVMFAPDVFKLICSGPTSVTDGVVIVSARGDTLAGYSDPAGITARLVSYNPGTGAFAIAASASDTVCWV